MSSTRSTSTGGAGVKAAVIYAREHGDLKVPFTFRVPTVDGQEATGKG
ncbi:hypothetical protein ACH4D3_37500 [Streptomyces sp. NPDC018026]